VLDDSLHEVSATLSGPSLKERVPPGGPLVGSDPPPSKPMSGSTVDWCSRSSQMKWSSPWTVGTR
jgi:hypothetical protein